MRTRSSSNIVGYSSINPTTTNPKRRNHRHSKQPLSLEESPIATMADQHTMAELLHAPTEGYAEAIVVPPILAEHFELKHSLINMMTSDQFFGLEKDNPHDHIRWFNKITSTIKYKDVANSAIKLMLFPFSLARAARRWLEKEPPRSILTWEDLVSKFINEFFPPLRTTNLRNEISNFEQPKLTHAVNQQTSAVTTAMTAILKQFQATPPPASVKAVEEICVTCGGAHPYYQCLAADGNTFLEYRDNIQGYVAAAAGNYNQGNSGYRPPGVANQTRPPDTSYQAPTQQNQVVPLSELEKIKKINDVNIKAMQAQINNVKNELRNEMQTSIQASMSNQTNKLKNMMASFFQINTASTSRTGSLPSNTVANPKYELKAITTRRGLVLDGPTIPMPHPFVNPEEDERVEETLADPEHGEFTIKLKCKALADLGASINMMPLSVGKKLGLPELISTRITLELANREICTPVGIARDVFISVGRFTFLADFVIVDYESDPRVPLILGRPFLRTARDLIDVHGEEMILRDGDERLILNIRHDTSSYSTQPHQESINMIDVYNVSHEEILEDLFATYHPSGNPTSSLTSHTALTSPEVNDDIFDPEGDIIENLLNLDKTKDLPPYHDNPLSGNPTLISEPVTKSSSPTLTSFEESDLTWEEFEAYLASDSFPPRNDDLVDYSLEEFSDELALITFLPRNDDLPIDIKSDLQEIEYLLNHDPIKEMDSILEDSVDSFDDNLVDTIYEMFTNEHALDYSSPPLWDDYDDELFDLETVNDNTYDDPFDSKEEKIKDSKILIDELDPPGSSDFLPSPEYVLVFYEDISEVDALSSTNNEDKVFNQGILIHKNHFEVTNRIKPDKNVKKPTNASLILEDFNHPSYGLPFHKEVPRSETLLSFSSENEEKVFNPGILTSKGVHTSFLPELSHRGPKALKVIKIFKSPMKIFPCSYGEDICILDVPRLHFYLP
ncbi:reverse transcriptase domain-containing protein [Tanacetum coccineum]